MAAGAFTGVAAASTNALPGDTLYGLKRGMEDLRLGMAGDDADRGKLLLDMASTRLQEASRLVARRRSAPMDAAALREVRGALLGMHNEAAEGHHLLAAAYQHSGSLGAIEALNAFSEQHRTTWTELRSRLPAQLSGVSAQVSSVLAAIEREVEPLQGLLPLPPQDATGTSGDPRTGGAAAASGTPSHGTPPGGRDGTGRHTGTGPSGPTTSGQGLIGGSGLLDPPPAGGHTPSTPTPTDGRAAPDVTLPPLLPGLLPGLGLDAHDT